jgi:hypothetical protein
MNAVLKWVGKGVAALALPVATVAVLAAAVYVVLMPYLGGGF